VGVLIFPVKEAKGAEVLGGGLFFSTDNYPV